MGLIVMNADDKHRLRSVNVNTKKGILNGSSKLNENQVREIRNRYIANKYGFQKVANDFGISKKTAMLIIKRESWKHVL